MSGAAGSRRALSLAPVFLVASPDDFLLEAERRDLETTWSREHPAGECETIAPPLTASRLAAAVTSPSLFADARLVLVPDAGTLMAGDEQEKAVAELIASLSWQGVTLVLSVQSPGEPKGALADAVTGAGVVRWLPVPAEPKPWEDVRLTGEQRSVLLALLERDVPEICAHGDVVEALLAAHGFRPRELIQAARSLAASGAPTVEDVRIQAGPGEVKLTALEDALVAGDLRAAVRLFAILSANGRLLGFRDDAIEADRVGAALASFLSRLLRQALAVRGHAREAGLGRELDPRRCDAPFWYPRVFKARLLKPLADHIAATPGSPVASLKPWPLHRLFRLASRFEDAQLLAALVALGASGAERERGAIALSAVAGTVTGLLTDRR